MSFPSGAYTPPPLPRRGLSPWAYVGIGCGVLTLIGFGGCAYVAVSITQAMNQPLDKKAALAELDDIPLYPGVQLDETTTKATRTSVGFFRFATQGRMAIVAFRSPDAPGKVLNWYAEKMPASGYSQGPSGHTEITGRSQAEQVRYLKNDIDVIVQAQPSPEGGSGTMLILMRMRGGRR